MEPQETQKQQQHQELMEAVLRLKFAQERTDRALVDLQTLATPLAAKQTPRAKFERWRDSTDGKRWKKSQHTKQNGQCANCQTPIALNGSHIDHIQPLSRSPQLACTPHNLQILCATCNQHKGDR